MKVAEEALDHASTCVALPNKLPHAREPHRDQRKLRRGEETIKGNERENANEAHSKHIWVEFASDGIVAAEARLDSRCRVKCQHQHRQDRFAEAALELEAKRELQIALAAFGEYFAEGRRICGIKTDVGGSAATAAAAPIRVVPHVKSFRAKLKAETLVYGNGLE